MQCDKCGHELDENGRCAYCEEQDAHLHVMTENERHQYTGITIDETSQQEHTNFRAYRNGREKNSHVFVKSFGLGSNWASKMAIILLVAAIVSFIVFIALPVALIGVAIGALVWLILSFLRG